MKNNKRGFTLVELMIALLLSSLLLAAIGKLFVDSGKGYKKQKTLSYLVEDGRYAQDILGKDIRNIGFLTNRKASGKTSTDVFKNDPNVLGSGLTLGEGEFIAADYNKAGFGGDNFDINHLVLRYQLTIKDSSAGGQDFDASPCQFGIKPKFNELLKDEVGSLLKDGKDDPDNTDRVGKLLKADLVKLSLKDRVVLTIYYYVDFDDALSSPVLKCRSKRENLDDPANAMKNKTSAAIPLISNVERMHILYGYDTDEDKFSNQYLTADQVASKPVPKPWNNVVSIRIYLIVGSEDKNTSYKAPGYTLDGNAYSVQTPGDKRLYRAFSTTIALRNIDVL